MINNFIKIFFKICWSVGKIGFELCARSTLFSLARSDYPQPKNKLKIEARASLKWLSYPFYGLTKLRGGRIFFLDQEITGKKANLLVRLGIAYVPQERNIFTTLTVRENLEIGAVTVAGGLGDRLEAVMEIFPELKERGGREQEP